MFGFGSLALFGQVGAFTAGASGVATFFLTFALVLVPTCLMGATLPLLVAHLVRRSQNVGQSVGVLYFVNTSGSALAAVATAVYLLGNFGQRVSVSLAATLNAIAALSIFGLWLWTRHRS